MSQAAIQAESKALTDFRAKLTAIDTSRLSEVNRADRELLIRSMDAGILANDVIKRWAKDPDAYSGGITNAAYVIMKRNFAPAADRLKSLIARERLMPATLAEARKNLENPPKIYTQIAIEQIDGNIGFFKNDVPAAFADVKDSALVRQFKQTNDSVMAALASYKTWLQKDLLPKSNGSYAYGADTYAKALAANEMVELPLDRCSRSPRRTGRRTRLRSRRSRSRSIRRSRPIRCSRRCRRITPRRTSCSRRRRRRSIHCGSSSWIITSSRFRRPTRRR